MRDPLPIPMKEPPRPRLLAGPVGGRPKRHAVLALILASLVIWLTACQAVVGPPPFVTPPPLQPAAPLSAAATLLPMQETVAPQDTPALTAKTPAAAATPPQGTTESAMTIALTEPLPLDPKIIYGRLDNGFTYYIRRNTEPARRAELWLVVNAGSVLEDEDQRGLAHFLEHMLFNGTQRFPSQELLNFLESLGMKFGPDINAYTSFDETVYNLQIPTDSEEVIARALDVLEDWAGAATLAVEEIDKERGVIVEEWRLREKTAAGRMRERIVPLLLGASRYAERLPIGDMAVVRNAPPEALRRFYEQWYRPDLMAVVAVGDFEAQRVEAMIRERFSRLASATAQPTARPEFDVPLIEGTQTLIVKDPEYPYHVVWVYQTRPAQPLETAADYRLLLTDYLLTEMLNQRYAQVARRADAPFLQAGAQNDNLVRPIDAYVLFALTEEGKLLSGLDALLTEFERARRHGFAATELERAKLSLLRFFESAYQERETSDSARYAHEYVEHFLRRIASPGIEYEYPLASRLLADITLADVNARAASLVNAGNRAVIVQAPDKAGLQLPTEAELLAVVNDVQAKAIAAYRDQLSRTALMEPAEIPTPVAVVREHMIPELGVTVATLANGVRVIMKPTDFKRDEVVFSGTSPGGHSLVSDADYGEATIAATLVSNSGVRDLDEDELTKLLAGKLVGVTPIIGELREGFRGYASPNDLETALQLIYLYATQPRRDDAAFQALRSQLQTYLQNRSLTPESAFQDALSEILCGTSVRCGPLPLTEVESLDQQRALEIYRERFADMDDFTFTFVGSFDVERLKALAQTYLGNLPATDRQETWRNVRAGLPEGVVTRIVRKGLEERSRTRLVFTGPFSPTLASQVRLAVLENILDLRLIAELREALGGTYAPVVGIGWEAEPVPTYRVDIEFVSDPKRVDELVNVTLNVLADLRTNGPAQADLNKAREQARLAHQEDLEDNSFWLNALENAFTRPAADPLEVLAYEQALDALTVRDLQQVAQEVLPPDRYVKVILHPEKFDAAVGQ